MKRKLFALLLAVCMTAALFTGCGGADSSSEAGGSTDAAGTDESSFAATETPSDAGTVDLDRSVVVTMGVSADFADMSPFGAQSAGKQYYKWLIYQYLFTWNGGELSPVIVKDYTLVDDLTLEATIYDFVTDFEGNPITAEDVIWCFQMATDSGNFAGQGLNYIESMTALDDYTIEFLFSEDQLGTVISLLTNVPIVSRAAYEASPDEMSTQIVGTGFYKIGEFVAGSTLTLERVENHWQTDLSLVIPQNMPVADKVILSYIPEAAQMSISLETGGVDIAGTITGTEIDRFMDDAGNAVAGYNITAIEPTQCTVLLFNCAEGEIFADNKDLRQAVLYAIDTEAIVASVLGGKGYACTTYGSNIFYDVPGEWSQQDYYNYNIDTARELLAASGAQDLELRIMTDNDATRGKVAQVMQASLMGLGIESTILTYDTALFNSYKNDPSEWDILIDLKNGSNYIPRCWKSSFDARDYDNNLTVNFVSDAELQRLIEDAINPATYSPEVLDDFHQYLKEQAYGYGLYVSYNYAVSADTVQLFVNDSSYPMPASSIFDDSYAGVNS